MYELENVESTPDALLDAYCEHFSRPVPEVRREKVIAVAQALKEAGLLITSETSLLASVDFLRVYTQPEQETVRALRRLFANFRPEWLTPVQATCLVCLQIQTEPFLTYLTRVLPLSVVKNLVNKNNQDFSFQDGQVGWQSIIIQNMFVQRLGHKLSITNSQLVSQLENPTQIINGQFSFVPLLEGKSVWEQVREAADFVLHLHAIYPYSLSIQELGFRYENYSYRLSFFNIQNVVPLLAYLVRRKNDTLYMRVYRKFIALCELLDTENLVLKNLSLDTLRVDGYENIWVTDITGAYRMQKGSILPNVNRDTGISQWEREIERNRLPDFPPGMRPERTTVYEEGDFEEYVEGEDEQDEGGTNINWEDIDF